MNIHILNKKFNNISKICNLIINTYKQKKFLRYLMVILIQLKKFYIEPQKETFLMIILRNVNVNQFGDV